MIFRVVRILWLHGRQGTQFQIFPHTAHARRIAFANRLTGRNRAQVRFVMNKPATGSMKCLAVIGYNYHYVRGHRDHRRFRMLRTLERVGTLRAGDSFSKDIDLKLERGSNRQNLRLIAFVQEPGYGKVAGAAMRSIGK